MDEKLLLKAVVLAGEIMLSSGAEVSRVENTMQFMLRRSNCEVTEAVVLATGLFVTMADPGGEPMTFSKRIPARSTNINRICRVNEVSRQFCHMELTVEAVSYTHLDVYKRQGHIELHRYGRLKKTNSVLNPGGGSYAK